MKNTVPPECSVFLVLQGVAFVVCKALRRYDWGAWNWKGGGIVKVFQIANVPHRASLANRPCLCRRERIFRVWAE
jgi:hypothetical protein